MLWVTFGIVRPFEFNKQSLVFRNRLSSKEYSRLLLAISSIFCGRILYSPPPPSITGKNLGKLVSASQLQAGIIADKLRCLFLLK